MSVVDLLKVEDVAAMLGVSKRTLHGLTASRAIPHRVLPHGRALPLRTRLARAVGQRLRARNDRTAPRRPDRQAEGVNVTAAALQLFANWGTAVTDRRYCPGCGQLRPRVPLAGRARVPRSDRLYCSNACRQRAYRERERKRREQAPRELTALELDALAWRHKRMLRMLQREPTKVDRVDALLAVVWPSDKLLEASLAAAREERPPVAA
jgi:hypothetical protein